MRQLFLTTLFISFLFSAVWGQTATLFNTYFDNAGFNGNTFCVEVLVSFDDVNNQLGSSNLVFDFDQNVISNPTLSSHTLSGPPFYYAPTVTVPVAGRASLNIELGFPGFGDAILAAPNRSLIARICFEYPITGQTVNLNWYENGSAGTVVYLDNESTRLSAGTLQNFSGVPASFPVEWLDFDAILVGEDARLQWNTGAELNNRHFEVERSFNGVSFQQIGQVASQGNGSTVQSYQFLDPNVSRSGREHLYYRLRQVDFDGSFTLSPVVRLQMTDLARLHLEGQPNPFRDQMAISFVNPSQSAFTLRVYNNLGQQVWSQSHQTARGQVQLNTRTWARGIYFLAAENEAQRTVYKLLKL